MFCFRPRAYNSENFWSQNRLSILYGLRIKQCSALSCCNRLSANDFSLQQLQQQINQSFSQSSSCTVRFCASARSTCSFLLFDQTTRQNWLAINPPSRDSTDLGLMAAFWDTYAKRQGSLQLTTSSNT